MALLGRRSFKSRKGEKVVDLASLLQGRKGDEISDQYYADQFQFLYQREQGDHPLPPGPSKDKPRPADDQLYMPFAEEGRGILPSLRLFEPIEVLGLTGDLEEELLEAGHQVVGDLHAQEELPEEARLKVGRYFAGIEDPRAVTSIDFLSLLRCAMGDLDRVSLYVFLRPYKLEGLLPLTEEEIAIARSLSSRDRKDRAECIEGKMLGMERQEKLWYHLHHIIQEFIRPWMGKGLGIRAAKSLYGRIGNISDDPGATKRVIRLLEDLYADSKEIWGLIFREAAEGIYTSSGEVAEHYQSVRAYAKSYFYHPKVAYPLPHLASLISTEMAKRWKGFKAGFVERVIKYDPAFRIKRPRHQDPVVYLSRY